MSRRSRRRARDARRRRRDAEAIDEFLAILAEVYSLVVVDGVKVRALT